jgi:uncharacterized protein YyaL (SSP411 family)
VATTNRLAQETSPYLRQHAGNPVHWYPWGPEAFEAARSRDVPILLSVGYSACHWCHVMAHQTFEDPAAAEVMNELFVNVKVDREERPDVDSVYMEAVQALSGSGGWPMTVFCLPDGRPFYAGTYFPRDQFVALARRIGEVWATHREEIEADAGRLADAVRSGTGLPAAGWAAGAPAPDTTGPGRYPGLLLESARSLMDRYDPEWGGFGSAPKFPQPAVVESLLAGALRLGADDEEGGRMLAAVSTTLDAMASGGIYDHVGGGFARYSTDRTWLVPHFEKMLYDNALLARLYTRAWQTTAAPHYRQVVAETLSYLLSPPVLQPAGGLSSAEDADSEGEEGRFYVWTLDEMVSVGAEAAVGWYGATSEGNWEGRNILWRPRRGDLLRPPEVEEARGALARARRHRARPGLDDKVLTEWNAMAVAALAEAGSAFAQSAWTEAAAGLGRFLLEHLRRPDGRWLRSWQGGRADHLAYAGDYAWLVEAFTRLAEATGQARWMDEARAAADGLVSLFWDEEGAGFFTTGHDAERLVARPKDTYDGALPSANATAAGSLLRLAALTGDGAYEDRARRLIDAMAPAVARAPAAFSALAAAAELATEGAVEVVVTGDRRDLMEVVWGRWRPGMVAAWGQPFPSPLWEGRTGPEQEGRAFVCRHYACAQPATTAGELAAQLDR